MAASKGHDAHTKAAENQRGLSGSFNRPIKLTYLGAGSGFCPKLISDVFQIPNNQGGEIGLCDIDTNRLETMHKLVQKLAVEHGVQDKWTIKASPERLDLLADSDYVVNSIEVSGVDCVTFDNDIPLKYGIDQCIGDTIGPGGLFKALRTVPVFLDIVRDVERLAPNAWILNYTNPMNIMCLAAGRISQLPLVGLCHSVQGTSHKLAKDAGVPYEEVTWQCAGINHLAWFTRLEHNGQSLYPVLRDKVGGRTGDIYEADPVRYDMMMHFGAFITESSGHLSEYLPYYRRTPELIKEHCRDGYRGGSRFYASNWPQWRKDADQNRLDMLNGEKDINWERSWEYASWIIEAREKDQPFRIYGNIMNNDGTGRGEVITNLPADGCVEVACMIDRTGIHPTRYGALPAQMAQICASNMAMFDLAATACIERSKEAAIHSLMLDPLTSAMCTPAQIRDMTLELFEAEAAFLPGFK